MCCGYSHLARKDFPEISERIRLEIEHPLGRQLAEAEWLTMNMRFVAGHRYHTDYARSRYAAQHAPNLAVLKERLNRLKGRKRAERRKTKPDPGRSWHSRP